MEIVTLGPITIYCIDIWLLSQLSLQYHMLHLLHQ